MLTKELLLQRKDDLQSLAEEINEVDMELLVDWLKEKDDTIRYTAFLLLQLLSASNDKVYKYWDKFTEMIDDENSYHRSLGIMLISENARWDKEERFGAISQEYLSHCDDEKFITARQCIQGLKRIIEYLPQYKDAIKDSLLKIDLDKRKDTQKNLLLLDIIDALGYLYKNQPDERIEAYLKMKYEVGNDKVKKAIGKILKS